MDDDLLVGRYQRRRMLGAGGMGDVWLADDVELGRSVAVKRLRFGNPAAVDAEMVERMLREARIVARLKHPAIVTLHDLLRVEGRPYLIMEYVEGESLAELVGREGALSWRRVAQVIADIAGALAAAHRAGVLHRDVKPANVLLDVDERGHLADFGIARGDEDVAITRAGELVGTVAYMPPEIARNDPALPASDVWSLGATFYAAVEGAAPFADSVSSVPAMLLRLTREEAPAPRRAGPASALLSRMLAMDPSRRPTADEIAVELTRYLALPEAPPSPVTREASLPEAPATEYRPAPTGSGPSTRPDPTAPPVHPTPLPRRRRRWPLVAAVLVLLVAAGGAGAVLLLGGDDTPPGARSTDSPGPGRGKGTKGTKGTDVTTLFDPVTIGGSPNRGELGDEDPGTFYVTSRDDDTLWIIDVATGKARQRTVCREPIGAAVSPDGRTAYVPCKGDNRLAVVRDGGTPEYLDLEGSPGNVRVDEAGELLYVPVGDHVAVLRADDLSYEASDIGAGADPGLVNLTPDGKYAFTPVKAEGTVVRIDTGTLSAVSFAIDGAAPDGVQLSADSSTAYVSDGTQGLVVAVDVETGDELGRVDLDGGTPGRIRIPPGASTAWVPDPDDGQIQVVDLDQGVVADTIAIGGTPGNIISFSDDGATAYVPDLESHDVAVIDVESHEVTHLDVGPYPQQINLSPDGSALFAVGYPDGTPSGGVVTAVALD